MSEKLIWPDDELYWHLGCRMFLIGEFCGGTFYTGWHLYVRESNARQARNADGGWGWIRSIEGKRQALKLFDIELAGDGTCDDDGIAEFVKRYPIARQRIWKHPRGCVGVNVTRCGTITLPDKELVK